MSECFIIVLQDCKHFDHSTLVNSPLIIERNVNTSNKSDSNWNSLFRNNASS